MSIQQFWPSTAEINNCIKTEAETAHESLILAVHQSYPLLKCSTNESDRSEVSVSEYDFLQAFLTPHLPTGTLLLPITGQSGVGKSHMIRWLNAQLKRTEGYQGMHVIRIPKSASLRKVIQLILDPLKGKEYDQLRTALQSAAAEVTPEDAGIRLRAGLELSLREHFLKLQQQAKESPQYREILYPKLGHTQKLPYLFKDNALSEHYDSILSDIIIRAIEGCVDGEERITQFVSDDLILPDNFELSLAGDHARRYYLEYLTQKDHLESATKILNEVLDDAISHAFNIGQNLGGKTLQDIFLEIREQLFTENKELILLVEDFAALSGIQDPLLKICIQEAIRDGKQSLCIMRTAIAVTDGDWSGRDTVLTRVQHQWVVTSALESDIEIIDRTVSLTGAYLNASRHGALALGKMFNNAELGEAKDLQSWIVPFEDENLDDEGETTLRDFGKCTQGFWLFPFNRTSLEELVHQHFTKGGKLVFNPRWIINSILRKVLLMRDLYEQGIFPPASFEGARASTFSAQLLSRSSLSRGDRDRYESLLRFWGGNPSNSTELTALSPRVCRAFSLEPLQSQIISAPATGVVAQPATEVVTQPVTEVVTQPTVESAIVIKWQTTLEEWVNGKELKQTEANRLRDLLAVATKSFSNWNAYFIAKREVPKSLFWIPNARGNQTTNFIKIAEDHRDPDGRLRRAILALVRYEENGSWDYSGGDEDSICYADLMQGISENVLKFFRLKYDAQLVLLARVLVWSNHVLGGAKPLEGNNVAQLLGAIWARVGKVSNGSLDPEWEELLDLCDTSQVTLLKELNQLCVAFQGAGNTPYAIDFARIVSLVSVDNLYDEISGDDINQNFRGDDFRPVLQRLTTELKPLRVKNRLAKTIKTIEQCQSKAVIGFAEGETSSEISSSLLSLIDNVQSAGKGWPSSSTFELSPQKLKNVIQKYRDVNIDRLLKNFEQVLRTYHNEEYFPCANALIRLSKSDFLSTLDFLINTDGFLTSLEKLTDETIITLQQNDPAPVVQEISITFDSLEEVLKKFKEVKYVAA